MKNPTALPFLSSHTPIPRLLLPPLLDTLTCFELINGRSNGLCKPQVEGLEPCSEGILAERFL